MKKLILIIYILAVGILAAEEKIGGFLQENINARATGMGESYVTLTENGGFVYNPAGLAFAKKNYVGAMKNKGYNDINSLEAIMPLVAEGGLGIGVNYASLKIDGIENWIDEYTRGGDFSNEEKALSVGLGLQYEKNLGVGITVRKLEQVLKGVKANGYTVDAGILYNFMDTAWFGATLTNIRGQGIKWDNERQHIDTIPMALKTGASFKLFDGGFNTAIEYESELSKEERPRKVFKIGEEVTINKMIALRIGKKIMILDSEENNADYITLGAGLIIGGINADYSYVKEELGDVHRVGLGLKF